MSDDDEKYEIMNESGEDTDGEYHRGDRRLDRFKLQNNNQQQQQPLRGRGRG
jgi:hypothetical protein